jgi:hypothetical protein
VGGIILKNPANGETMIYKVKPLQGKLGQAKHDSMEIND